MTPNTVILIALLLLILGTLPGWRHSESWGFVPSGAVGAVLVAFLAAMAVGQI